MKTKLMFLLRMILGAMYVIFGLNYFVTLVPVPPLSAPAMQLMSALIGSGYLLAMAKITEIVGGLILLSGRATPFALILLAPITVNIVAFHLFLDPGSGAGAYLIAAIHLYLGLSRLETYKPLFR